MEVNQGALWLMKEDGDSMLVARFFFFQGKVNDLSRNVILTVFNKHAFD